MAVREFFSDREEGRSDPTEKIPYRNFNVLPPDPHGFDGDHDGIGCET